ncbi:diaminopimelate epimerase [Xanthobacter tagetidis]|uniref:Diaminopimelate epimerase n=1 Tax=Xanthobacter tagetidis TaxID=60216 RepID=A0A3L7AM18_9HYPH|nr:diaminopimelate epimerase [Xanthobacter tagetidis]MBB6307891.1 diaminopimelate epimerase [Xanthobacter tagetidis]RLP81546.1 diaminopimelate epimerase [Xanthobacter tagetidis]
MDSLAHRPFVKMNGLGNEILVLDLRADPVAVAPAAARALARREALPFDQAMVLYPPRRPDTSAFVRILNSDGSASAACGNGTRCIAALEAEATGSGHVRFESEAGLLDCRVHADGTVTVDMGAPRFSWRDIPLARDVDDTSAVTIAGFEQFGPASLLSMGNPHAVFFVPDADAVDVEGLGAALEHHPLFPERANISFASLTGPDAILLHVWERGAGRTRACGTAGCATAVAAARTGRTGRTVSVRLPGGLLGIEWRPGDDGRESGHVLMTGPVEREFSGLITPAMLGEAA